MKENYEDLLNDLSALCIEQADDKKSATILAAMATLEIQAILGQAMHEFIESEYRGEFEETLDFGTQELYREHFELSHNDADFEDAYDLLGETAEEFGEDEED
jgi:hypothetical protein